jgi:hypothetical protein
MSTDEAVKAVCCFCGESLRLREATLLIVIPAGDEPGEQTLYCHAKHLRAVIIDTIVLLTEVRDSVTDEE